MASGEEPTLVAFAAGRLVARGTPAEVALTLKRLTDEGDPGALLVFDAKTSRPFELDLRGSEDLVAWRHGPPARAAVADPGAKKVRAVAGEVRLLGRHWSWLAEQPGGASATLRRLVEAARRDPTGEVARRHSQESAYRFMSVIAGDEVGFEEATRALFAGDVPHFEAHTKTWPPDVRQHTRELASAALADGAEKAD
ncbi:MAG: DUF2239 family protein [Acidobacteriota bacterium]